MNTICGHRQMKSCRWCWSWVTPSVPVASLNSSLFHTYPCLETDIEILALLPMWGPKTPHFDRKSSWPNLMSPRLGLNNTCIFPIKNLLFLVDGVSAVWLHASESELSWFASKTHSWAMLSRRPKSSELYIFLLQKGKSAFKIWFSSIQKDWQ